MAGWPGMTYILMKCTLHFLKTIVTYCWRWSLTGQVRGFIIQTLDNNDDFIFRNITKDFYKERLELNIHVVGLESRNSLIFKQFLNSPELKNNSLYRYCQPLTYLSLRM